MQTHHNYPILFLILCNSNNINHAGHATRQLGNLKQALHLGFKLTGICLSITELLVTHMFF